MQTLNPATAAAAALALTGEGAAAQKGRVV